MGQQSTSTMRHWRRFLRLFLLWCFVLLQVDPGVSGQSQPDKLELTRAARPWEFVSALGTRAGLLGNEGGNLEAWVYPLKIMRNFHLRFKIDNESIAASALVRSVSVRPESTTITYVWDTFTVRETLFVPVHEAGAVIALDVDTAQPLQMEAVFERDFQLEWPATMGGSDIDWSAPLHAFTMSENQQKFNAIVGSPSATDFHIENVTNYTAAKENSFGFGTIPAGKTTRLIVVAASFQGLPSAQATYKKLSSSYDELLADSAAYYHDYAQQHLALELPDAALQQAYEWAQVSVLQGLVNNPYLGTGLVAGYRGSGDDQRPGYAWFFGRDALWTSLATDAEGDFETTRSALEFLSKYQRSDGKVPHEIAQGASFVPWFQSMPYAYASADATPLYIVAMNDYVQHSGDAAFAAEKWSNVWRAYQFMVATYDKDGLPRNAGVGHGWVEGGPLLPLKSELYQTGVVVEALRALSSLARSLDKADLQVQINSEYLRERSLLNKVFWSEEKHRYSYAVDASGQRLDIPSALAMVPMWFGLMDETKARSMIEELDGPDIQTDWGMRIIPASSLKYEPAGYHNGTVWPLFTGWASVGEYRYHEALPAYANLRSNALLTFDGSLGHIAEVLSGTYYQTLATGSPHQIWSSAMVISPLLTGMLGLDTNAFTRNVRLMPHVPADWNTLAVKHVRAGACMLDLHYRRAPDAIMLEIERKEGSGCTLDFAPAISLRAQVTNVEIGTHSVPFRLQENDTDQHVAVHLNLAEASQTLTIRLKNDFGISQDSKLPSLGSTGDGLRVMHETWSEGRDVLTLDVASSGAGTYELGLRNANQLTSVEGADLVRQDGRDAKLRIAVRERWKDAQQPQKVVLHFAGVVHTKKTSEVFPDGAQLARPGRP